jgi:hypothetical protein
MKSRKSHSAFLPGSSRSTNRRSCLGVLGLVTFVLVGSGCGIADDGYTYVNNEQEKFFFKLPDEWSKHKAGKTDSGPSKTAWTLFFDTTKKPADMRYEDPSPKVPAGIAQVFHLTPAGTEIMNEVTLRSMVFGPLGADNDPIKLADEDPRVEVLRYDRFVNKKGQWGSTVVINVNLGEATGKTDWVTMAQKAIYDPQRRTIYRVGLKCAKTCYSKNGKTMKQVLDSLQLRP